MKKPKPPRGPRNLKAGGFTNGLWRLEERAERLDKIRSDRDLEAELPTTQHNQHSTETLDHD